MTTRFAAPDLLGLPSPQAIEVLSHDEYTLAYRQRLVARFSELGISYDVGHLETDPAMVVGQTVQYERVLDRQRVNDAVRAVMVPSARGSDLDALGAQYETTRLPGETDDRFRYRVMLAFEALATTGTYGGYAYFALGSSLDVLDAAVYGPETGLCTPGQVLLVVLGKSPSGLPCTAEPALLDTVAAEAGRRDRRPLTDQLLVRSAVLREYRVRAHLTLRSPIDTELARQRAEDRILRHVVSYALIGERSTTRSMIAALGSGEDGQSAVADIDLQEPSDDIGASLLEVPWCTSVLVTASVRSQLR